MITNRIYEHQNLLLLKLVSFLVGLRTYQHPCMIGDRRVYHRLGREVQYKHYFTLSWNQTLFSPKQHIIHT